MIFWTTFIKKGYFRSKRENSNITIEFSIFKLVYVPNLILNRQFWFFGPTLPKRNISRPKQGRWMLLSNSPYLNYCRWQISSLIDNFYFLNTIFQKRFFLIQKTKFEHLCWIQHIRINLCTKFHLKQTITIFRIKFTQTGYFLSKAGEMNIIIEFNIFELV